MIKKINQVYMKYFLSITVTLLSFVSHAQHNPVLDQNFPDPTVILAPDGKYYAYATNTKLDDKWINIQVATSTDLFNWKYTGDALPQKPTWASHTQNYWAPHVLYDAS